MEINKISLFSKNRMNFGLVTENMTNKFKLEFNKDKLSSKEKKLYKKYYNNAAKERDYLFDFNQDTNYYDIYRNLFEINENINDLGDNNKLAFLGIYLNRATDFILSFYKKKNNSSDSSN